MTKIEREGGAGRYIFGDFVAAGIAIVAAGSTAFVLYSSLNDMNDNPLGGLFLIALPTMWLCVPALLVSFAHTAATRSALPLMVRRRRLIVTGVAMLLTVSAHLLLFAPR